MNKAIIHLSDLHVTFHKDSNGELIDSNNIQSFFSTKSDGLETGAYLDKIIEFIRTEYNNYEYYLIITGDITDKASNEEFDKATEVLNKFINELNIDKKNKVLIVPGDHDVNWDSCKMAYNKIEEKDKIKAYDCHNEKFEYYKKFIDNFYNDTTFDPNKAISRTMIFENEILFLGLNSNFRVGTKSAVGFIPKEKLEEEINELSNDKPIIGIFHHNFGAEYDDNAIGQWDKLNLNQIKKLLKSNDTRAVFYGNEHTPSSSFNKQLYLSSCGSIGCKKSNSRSFKIYKIKNENNGIKLEIDLISQMNHGNHDSFKIGYFQRENNPENEISEIPIKEPHVKSVVLSKEEIPYLNETKVTRQIEADLKGNLFKIVKDKQLFHSGHFHWSETSRAHNWIDITKILNNNQDLTLAKDTILDLVHKNIKNADFDFILGLGIEGNILSTKVSIKYDKPYSYLPYSYRYEDHNKSEKTLYFENEGKYKTVLIITDVVNDGRTIRKLIHKEGRADKFFKDVDKIYVVSLFYTGDEINKNSAILNLSENKISTKNIKGDHIEERIEYFYVLDLKVEKCPYGENYRDECLIMREPSLGCVHKFYNEKPINQDK